MYILIMHNFKAFVLNLCLLSVAKKKAECIYKNSPGAAPAPKRGTFNTVGSTSEIVMYILFFQREPCTVLSPPFTLYSVWRQGPADWTIADQRTGQCFSLLAVMVFWIICYNHRMNLSPLPWLQLSYKFHIPQTNTKCCDMCVVLLKLCWLCVSSVLAVNKYLLIQAVFGPSVITDVL